MSESDAAKLREELRTRDVDLLLIHVAEGSPQDMESSVEFLALKGHRLLGSHMAIIHGTALVADDFRQILGRCSASLVSAEQHGTVRSNHQRSSCPPTESHRGASPDWSPTGSTNMLAELGYASRYNRGQLSASSRTESYLECRQ